MTEREWAKFFELMDKITDLPNLTHQEKAKEVKRRAEEDGERAESALEEFTSWDFGY